jgi:hypothetical protein
MNGGVSTCFIRFSALTNLNKRILEPGETFSPAIHLSYQYHFEDTPREAVKANALAASLLLGLCFHLKKLCFPNVRWILHTTRINPVRDLGADSICKNPCVQK